MEKNTEYPARRLYKYLIWLIAMVVILLGFIFLLFKPYYKVTIDGEIVGYYKDRNEFEQVYNSIPKQTEERGVQTEQYLTHIPLFEMELVKPKYARTFDKINLLINKLDKDYTIYCIKVNGEEKIYVETNETAEELVKEIKKEVKESTEIIIEKKIEKNLSLLLSNKDKTKQDVIDRNKRVTSRGGVVRTNTSSKYCWPTTSTSITSNFGARWGKTHTGTDIGVPIGSSIYAISDGKVILSGWNGGYGYQVKVQHSNGMITTYAHCSKLLVKKGQIVEQGDIIAKSGNTGNSTGPHLHVEFIINGEFKNPLNYL